MKQLTRRFQLALLRRVYHTTENLIENFATTRRNLRRVLLHCHASMFLRCSKRTLLEIVRRVFFFTTTASSTLPYNPLYRGTLTCTIHYDYHSQTCNNCVNNNPQNDKVRSETHTFFWLAVQFDWKKLNRFFVCLRSLLEVIEDPNLLVRAFVSTRTIMN